MRSIWAQAHRPSPTRVRASCCASSTLPTVVKTSKKCMPQSSVRVGLSAFGGCRAQACKDGGGRLTCVPSSPSESFPVFRTLKHPGVMAVTLAAAGILMVTMGMRQSLGLYLGPINTSTGLGIVTLRLAMAIGQFMWGASQPIAGALAARHGPRWVLLGGVFVLALATAVTPFMSSGLGLALTLGVLSAAGSGSARFSVLIGAAAQRMPAESRGTASEAINAGGAV